MSEPPTNPDRKAAVFPGEPKTFVQARNFTKAARTSVDLVVIHTMESPEKPDTAERVAAWFAGASAPQASAHYCVDEDSIVQCVHEEDVAWHAPGANRNGIGVEHAGYAGRSAEAWNAPQTVAMLELSAKLVARVCERWAIPVAWVSADGLRAGVRGITGHKQCTDAFSKGVGHWDPGPYFPIDRYVALVKASMR